MPLPTGIDVAGNSNMIYPLQRFIPYSALTPSISRKNLIYMLISTLYYRRVDINEIIFISVISLNIKSVIQEKILCYFF